VSTFDKFEVRGDGRLVMLACFAAAPEEWSRWYSDDGGVTWKDYRAAWGAPAGRDDRAQRDARGSSA